MRKTILFALAILLTACGPDYDYKTNHGMRVILGAYNNPGPKEVENWTDFTIGFWRFFHPDWLVCLNNNAEDTYAMFYDKDVFNLSGGCSAAGFALASNLSIHISNGTLKEVRAVFIHELSHVFVGQCGKVWGEKGSHAIFNEVKLSAIVNLVYQ